MQKPAVRAHTKFAALSPLAACSGLPADKLVEIRIQNPYFAYDAGMSSPQRVEERSKALFGKKHMLTLCDGIARSKGRFTAKEMSESSGVAYPTTHRLLLSLTSAGLLERSPRELREREQWYVRIRHGFWTAAQQLHGHGPKEGRSSASDGR